MQILEHGQEQEQTLLFFPCTAEPVWAFPPERFTLPGHDPVKEYDTMEVYLKTYSDRTIHNVFWSGNNYALPQPPAASDTKITYWYGDEEKKDRRSNIRFIKRYFPQIRIHGIPKNGTRGTGHRTSGRILPVRREVFDRAGRAKDCAVFIKERD